jgi:hypothetical protein
MAMPQTAHRLDAADLLDDGTYSLRRALDGLANRSHRLAAGQLPGQVATPEHVGSSDPAGDVAVADLWKVLMDT